MEQQPLTIAEQLAEAAKTLQRTIAEQLAEAAKTLQLTIAEQLAEAAKTLQLERTGHSPSAVTVVLSGDTLVMTLHDALTPAERALARTPEGAAQVQDFHRRLFEGSSNEMRRVIERLTGRAVRGAAAEVVPASGAVVHAFTSGTMVHVFLLSPGPEVAIDALSESAKSLHRAADDGLPAAGTPVLHA